MTKITHIHIDKVDFFTINSLFTLSDKKQFDKLLKQYEEVALFHIKDDQFFIAEEMVFWWKSEKKDNKK